MAIISVQQPNIREPKEKEDPFDRILKGLQIASNIYGIKTSFEQSELNELRKQQLQQDVKKATRLSEDIYTPLEIAKADLVPVESSNQSSIALKIQQPSGDVKEGFFVPRSIIQANLALKEKSDKKIEDLAKEKQSEEKEIAKETFKRESDLRKEYLKPSDETIDSLGGLKKVESAATNPNPTGATDVALIFGFMKTIDPGSTVREGEFATVENTRGVPDQIRAIYNRVTQGERLSAEQRQNYLTEAKRQALGRLEIQNSIDDRYRNLAIVNKMNPENIINPMFSQEYNRIIKDLKTPQQSILPQTQNNIPIGVTKPKTFMGSLFDFSAPSQQQPRKMPINQNEIDSFIRSYTGD